MNTVVVGALNGVSLGMVLFLLAAGLSITMGLMGVLNLAHGALYMLAGYIVWYIYTGLGLNFGVATVISIVLVGLVALVIEAGILRALYGAFDGQILAMFGVLLIITNVSSWLWSPSPTAPVAPNLLNGHIKVGQAASYPVLRIFVIAMGLAMALLLWWLQERTALGALVRAAMDDREIATSMGLNVKRISLVVFVGGSIVAAIGGVLGQMLNGVQQGFSLSMLTAALIVIVIGGVGSIQGAFVAALLIGLITSFGVVWLPNYTNFLTEAAMVLMLLIRPTGLLGRHEIRTA